MENSELRKENSYTLLSQNEKNQKLLDSASLKQLNELKLLLEAGAEVDSPRSDGETALTISAENGCTEIVDVLIRAGANLETKSQSGQSVLSGSVKKNRLRTTTLLFSAMTQEQVNNAIFFEGLASTPPIFSQRTISRYLEKFKQIVAAHRMAIFKKIGPLFLDSNSQNGFFSLLPELREMIVLDYCKGQSNEPWQNYHSKLDAKAICSAIDKNKKLNGLSEENDELANVMSEVPIDVNGALANAMSQIQINVEEAKMEEEKQKKPKKNKSRNKYHLSNYSPKQLRKSPQQSSEEESSFSLDEVMGKLEIGVKEAKVRNKLDPRQYSPSALRKNKKQSEEETGLEEAMSQLEIGSKETKQKSKYNPLSFSPKLFRKKSKKSQEIRSTDDAVKPVDTIPEEEKLTETKKKSKYAFLGK